MITMYQQPSLEDMLTPTMYYEPTEHFAERYRLRVVSNSGKKSLNQIIARATDKELGLRANYMLMFSIHGKPGKLPHTEERYYFDWSIIIDHKKKTIVTMFIDEKREQMPPFLFGDPKFRKKVYAVWFKNKKKKAGN